MFLYTDNKKMNYWYKITEVNFKITSNTKWQKRNQEEYIDFIY